MKIKLKENFIKHGMVSMIINGIACIALVMIYAFLLSNEKMQMSSITIMLPIIQFISAMLGAIYLCIMEVDKRILKSIIVAGIFMIVIFLISITFSSGQFQFNINTTLAVLLGYLCTAFVYNTRKIKSNTRSFKYRNG